jgi:hypothetical protein
MAHVPSPEAAIPPPASSFRFALYHDGAFLCEPTAGGRGLYIVHETGCSCSAWHSGERPCCHQIQLGIQLITEGMKLVNRGLSLTGDDEDIPIVLAGSSEPASRCPRCASRLYEYPDAVRCQGEACGYWRILR